MKRLLAIAKHANVIDMVGFDRNVTEPTDIRKVLPNPFRSPIYHKLPNYVRWSWNPATGEMVIGAVGRHITHIPNARRYPFDAWVRGFYFLKENLVCVRPWQWNKAKYDDFDDNGNKRVAAAAVRVLKQVLPDAEVKLDIDNNWLKINFSHYATSW